VTSRRRGTLLVLLSAFVASCLGAPSPSATEAPSAAPASATARPSPAGLAADIVFRRVSQSVAFVGTDVGTGSGLMIDGRHVITNAHVIKPYRAARLVLADGTVVADAPVVAWDLIADLVVLDAGVGIARATLPISDVPSRTGERVYLVGYPLADEASPNATITEGIISGAAFEWIDDLTFHQTDAVIEDGQSGGVLVDEQGGLIGITGGSRGRFAIALDAGDAAARVERLLAGEDVDGTSDHLLPRPDPTGETTFEIVLRHRADVHVWLIPGDRGDQPATISLTSDRPVGLFGLAAGGRLGHAAGPPGTDLSLSLPFDATGPYAVKVEPIDATEANIKLHSSVGLTPFEDGDDGRTIELGGSLVGGADYAGDIDWYRLGLAKGDDVVVRASSAGDPALFVDRAGDAPAPLAVGHDDGGPLGGDDVVEFRAPTDGEYLIVVADPRFQGSGAYRLTVERGRGSAA
jgi:putative serine protease PepD